MIEIALIHYSYPPTIGGVERVVAEHARLLADRGRFKVRVLAGSGENTVPEISLRVVPGLSSADPVAKAMREALLEEETPQDFPALRNALQADLRRELEGCQYVFVHNLMTMPFNPAATAALWNLASDMLNARFFNWIHDLAATNPDYPLPYSRPPWDLLTHCHPRMLPIAVSRHRKKEADGLFGLSGDGCRVVPNGIDPSEILGLTEPVAQLARDRALFERDIVFFYPARLLRRKNVEFAIEILAAIRATGQNAACLVTGAADPHNADSQAYRESLRRAIAEKGLEDSFFFLSERFPVSDADLASLYVLSDALLYPSRQEGFGLPLIEGSLARLPVFCSGIPPLDEIRSPRIHFFPLNDSPDTIAAWMLQKLLQDGSHQQRKEMLRKYAWSSLFEQHLAPLFQTQN